MHVVPTRSSHPSPICGCATMESPISEYRVPVPAKYLYVLENVEADEHLCRLCMMLGSRKAR